MVGFRVDDWDDAYENSGNIAGSADIIARWQPDAATFRETVCSETRAEGDLFLPEGTPKGLFVFIHGGYWQMSDVSWWSHMARGAIEAGWAAFLPRYELCPKVTITEITTTVGGAINSVDQAGPLVITGHSAGGHLAAAMCAEDTPLTPRVARRVRHCVPISGLPDLRPLLNTKLNDALRLDEVSAVAQSPILKRPLPDLRLTAWVGGAERSEFLRQNRMLADMWRGLGAWTDCVEEPDKHHFSVLDGLQTAVSPLMKCALSE